MPANSIENIDQYISQFDTNIQERLIAIRKLIRDTVPEAVELISYQMPAFKYKGKILVYFAAFKNHIGFYATPESNLAFKKELEEYKTSKGSIQLSYNKPLPMELLQRIVLHKAEANEMKRKK